MQKSTRKRGQKLSLQEAESLLVLIIEKRKLLDEKSNVELVEELSSETGYSEKTIRKYLKEPSRLDNRVAKDQLPWVDALSLKLKIFLQMGRLLSWQLAALHKVMNPTIKCFLSRETLRNYLYKVFSLIPDSSTREVKKNLELKRVRDENLKIWPTGTFGLHAVELRWTKNKNPEATCTRGRPPGEGQRSLLIAAASRYNKRLFRGNLILIDIDADEAEVAKACAQVLDKFRDEVKCLRLVATESGDGAATSFVSAEALRKEVGEGVSVEVDVPTVDLGYIRVPKNWISLESLEAWINERVRLAEMKNRRL